MIVKIVKLLNIFHTKLFIYAFFKGVGAGTEHLKLLNNLDCNHIIDIGANKGQFSLAARYVFPKAHITSFEPLSKPADKFNQLFENDENIILHQSAIGPEKQTLPMHVSKKADSSSIFPIGKSQASTYPGTEESHIEKITIAPLSKFIRYDDLKPPVFVKIDVQGYELEVLKGCEKFLEFFTYIYVECSFIELYEGQALVDEVIEYLSDYSFKLNGVYNINYDEKGVAIQGDFLFVKSKD